MKIKNKYLSSIKTATPTKISAFAFILLLVMTLMMAFAQPSLAQVGIPQPEKTVGYISVAPKLIGVGQTATVNIWIFPLPNFWDYDSDFRGFFGITVTFVRPDGTEDTFMPVDGTGQYEPGQTQSLAALYFYYEPDMAGDWSVSFTMPAQDLTDDSGTVQYMACTSNSATFTVTQEEQLAGLLNGYPWAELPNENTYWDHPISGNNREWSAISGDWLGSSSQGAAINNPTCRFWQPYGPGPNTAHIVWNQQIAEGGLVGGDWGSISYAARPGSAVIMAGKVFTNIPNSGQFECVDLTTGEVLYTADGSISYGIHLPGNVHAQANLDPSVVLPSSYGATPTSYLLGTSGSTWKYYDPLTGKLMRTLANATESSIANKNNPGYRNYLRDSYRFSYKLIDGTNLAYGVASGTMFAWNLSKVVRNNWPTGIEWKRDLPVALANRSIMCLGVSADMSTMVVRSNPNQYWGYSTEDGDLIWGPLTIDYASLVNEQITFYGFDGFIVFNCVDSTYNCYSMSSGDLLWTSPSFSDSPWATTWTVYNAETHDYDNFYVMLPDGTMSALSLATGQEVWRSQAFPSTEYTNNVVPYVMGGLVMVGGNIYCYAGYSTGYQINPIPRFAMLVCVDAATGDIKYTLHGGVAPVAAANGYFIGSSTYDGKLYCLGKGQTSTSVTIQDDVVAKGDTVLIKGNVLDESPAQTGTPAVSDEDMSEWMDYLNMQNATLLNNPPTPDGVPVNLYVVKPDGTEEWITTVASNSFGNFAHNYVPSTEGTYTIIAKFEGTESYWPSSSQTYFTATKATAASGTIEPEPLNIIINTEMVIIIAIIAIAIIAAVAYLAIRRRK